MTPPPPGLSPAPPPWIERAERVALALAALLVASLHAANLLLAGPLWRDEVGDAVYAAMPSWAHVWATLRYDNFPLGLLVALRTWRGLGLENLGGPDFGYRVYGMLVGLALVGAFWVNARLFGGPRGAPWFSLGLFAAGGFAVRVGDSVRPYGLGWVFIVLTFGLVWRVVQSPRPGRVAWAACAAVLSVQCLYQNAFLLFGIGVAGMCVAARAGRGRAVAAVAGIGTLAALSLLPYALGPIHDASAWSMIDRPGLAWNTMAGFLWSAAGSLQPVVAGLWVAVVAAVVWAVCTLPCQDLGPRGAGWYAAGSVAVAVPLYLGFLKALGMSTTPWYYLLPLALTANALDVLGGVMSGDVRWRVGRVVFLAAAVGMQLSYGWNVVQTRVTNADAVAACVGRNAQPGDCVLVSPWAYGVSFHYYYKGAVLWTTLPPLADHTIHRYDLMKAAIASTDPLAGVFAQLEQTLRAGHRVWIVGWLDGPPPGQAAPARLRPAPTDPAVGWNESRYMVNWTLQVGDYLRAHGVRATDATLPIHQPISTLENMDLYCVQGWQP